MPEAVPWALPLMERLSQRNERVLANLRLVRWVYRRYFVKRGRWFIGDENDCLQEGRLALIRVAERFDEMAGFTFSTFAFKWIYGSLLNRSKGGGLICRPLTELHLGSKYQKAFAAAGKPPLSMDEIKRPLADPHDCFADLERLEEQEKATRLTWRLLALLPERQAKVLELRYLCGKTLQEVGKEFGVTRERVRQLESMAIRNIRDAVRGTAWERLLERVPDA